MREDQINVWLNNNSRWLELGSLIGGVAFSEDNKHTQINVRYFPKNASYWRSFFLNDRFKVRTTYKVRFRVGTTVYEGDFEAISIPNQVSIYPHDFDVTEVELRSIERPRQLGA
jgi:hypothetical protein